MQTYKKNKIFTEMHEYNFFWNHDKTNIFLKKQFNK